MDPLGTSLLYLRDRFTPRARALFWARLAIDLIVVLIMLVPAFAREAGVRQPYATYWFAGLFCVHLAAFFWVGRRFDRLAVFTSLCVDLLALVYLVTVTGGLRSPIMQGQLVYTVIFATIFPTPLAILPPLLTLPVIAKIEQLLGTQIATRDLMLLLWYFVANAILVYIVVYLNRREDESFQELDLMQRRRRRYALTEERNRIARDMHDGLGAILSSIVIQAEYVHTQARELQKRPAGEDATTTTHADLIREIEELRRAGQEGMEELRRAVRMMRDDFDLVEALEEMCLSMASRTRASITFSTQGTERPLEPHQQLTCYRVLQESLANAIKHAAPDKIVVELAFSGEAATLTVTDDGVGFDPATHLSGHYGLSNMRERAHRSGGELSVDSLPGRGTTITLRIFSRR